MWQNFYFLRILKYIFKENNIRLLCNEMQHIVEVLNTLATAFKHTSHLFHLWELPIVLHDGVKTFWSCTRICFHCFNIARNFLFLLYKFFSGLRLKLLKISCEIEMVQAIRSMHYFFTIWNKTWQLVVISFSHFAHCKIWDPKISGTKCVKKGQLVIPILFNWRNIMHWSHYSL